ncbi:hypothetical protein QUB68_24980 [Microcoleus sp. A006_D1]|uniref:hypothetical protein n=1 Tax=Microcoleus sp. A006_D1 TaxID=3055267 RepID=UPI002FD2C172
MTKRKVTGHIKGRITKLAEEAIAVGLIVAYEATSLGYKLKFPDVLEDVELSCVAAGIYLLQILGKIK